MTTTSTMTEIITIKARQIASCLFVTIILLSKEIVEKILQSLQAIERQNALAFWLGFDFTLIKSTVLSIDDIGGLITATNNNNNKGET